MYKEKIPVNPSVLLYGYGLEGKSSENWIQQNLEPTVIEIFEDDKGKGAPDWNKFDLVVKSPGIPPDRIPSSAWPKVTSNLRLFMENLNELQRAKVIGITGSKGKSTTAKFTYELLMKAGLKSQIIGNFGVPALDIWAQLDALDFVVAECSSFQLYDLKVSPKYALFLSFFPDHLDWHNASEIDYFAAKENLWAHQKPGDSLLVPNTLPVNVGSALAQGAAANRADKVIFTDPVELGKFPADSNLRARHFRENLGTVWQLAEVLGIKPLAATWHQVAADFQSMEHRLEVFAKRNGFTFINDSIATSPDATEAGIMWQAEKLSGLILDGADTGVGDFTGIVDALKQKAPQTLVALIKSEVAQKFKEAARGNNIISQEFDSYADAVQWLDSQAQSGVILFSPGGKSFNRFNNYSERGRYFKNLVMSS